MRKQIQLIFILSILVSCGSDTSDTIDSHPPEYISAVDISTYPEIEMTNPSFYDSENHEKELLPMLKDYGINTIRLRLWVNPENGHSGFEEVKQFSQALKAYGFKVWLSLHYSDTWADPGHQTPPQLWQGISYLALKDSVYAYTKKVVDDIHPEFIQIGNEINSGLLHPEGDLSTNVQQFKALMTTAILAVRSHAPETKIILHYAGITKAEGFFDQLREMDYDIIGLSYYPIWHGKDLNALRTTLQQLHQVYAKDLVIAETAYPFTLDWNDWTHNIVGLEEHLILPEFPATPQGQKAFVKRIKDIVIKEAGGLGFCYWGAEWIAWKGEQATDASPWENQAVFDFNHKALPVLEAFNIP